MTDSKMCKGKLTRTSVEAVVGIVVAGAIFVILLIITKGGSGNPDSLEAGKFVGIRHDAASISRTADVPPDVPNPAADQTLATASPSSGGQEQEPSNDTVVRNGVTIVSPPLLVPVIDIDSMQTVNESGDGASAGKAFSRKPSRYTNRSHTRHQSRIAASRWTAYGLALR